LALRQAIILAVDRSALITASVGSPGGVVPIGNRFFSPQSAGYVDDTGGRYLHANVAQAQQVLAAAGYLDAGNVLKKGSTPVSLTLIAGVNDALHQAEEAALVSDLSAVGIVVHVSVVSDLASRLAEGNFDLALVDQVGSTDPEAQPLPTLLDMPATVPSVPVTSVPVPSVPGSSVPARSLHPGTTAVSAPPGSAPAVSSRGVTSPATVPSGTSAAVRAEVAALVRQAEVASTVAAQDAAYSKLDVFLWFDAASLPLFQLPAVLAYQTRYSNLGIDPSPFGIGDDMAEWAVPNRS
jgi:ABC-type transport system substrate-binding protein